RHVPPWRSGASWMKLFPLFPPHDEPAVNAHYLPRDEGGAIRGEEGDGLGHLLGPAETPDRVGTVPGRDPRVGTGVLAKDLLVERRHDRSWCDRVHPNAEWRKLDRCLLRQGIDSALCCRIGRPAFEARESLHRRHVDDGALLLLAHLRQTGLH